MTRHSHSSSSHKRDGWKRRLIVVFLVAFSVALLLQLIASPIAKSLVNRKLAAMDGFAGHAGSLRIQLWRGGVEVGDFEISERGHEADAPLVRVRRASLAISWPALFHGKLGGNAVVENPQVTMVKREETPKTNKEEAGKAAEKNPTAETTKAQMRRWQDALAEAFPMEISNLEIKRGTVRFLDHTRQPEPDLAIKDLHVLASNLGNRPEAKDGPLPAKLEVAGTTTGNGKLKISAQAAPLAEQLRFDAKFELREQQLPPLNNFLLAYADADVSRGTFEIYIEVKAADGAYDGYVKPLFKDLDFKNPSDENKNVAQRVKEKVVSVVAAIMENDADEKVATKVPFSGNFADNKVDVWTAIVNLFRNAFVEALRSGFDGQPAPQPAAKAE